MLIPCQGNTDKTLQSKQQTKETITKEEKEEEGMFDNLESVLLEAKQIRESSQGGTFSSDDERREL